MNYLCKFDSAGNHKWITQYYAYSRGGMVRYNPVTDRIIMLGRVSYYDCIFGSDTLPATGVQYSYFVSYNAANGQVESVKTFPGALYFEDGDCLMDIDNEGNIYFTTSIYNDTLIVGGDSIIANGADFILWKINPNGTLIWARHFTGNESQGTNELHVRHEGSLFVSLNCNESLVSGSDTLWYEPEGKNEGIMQLDSAGNFIRMIGASETSISCKSFAFDGNDLIVFGQSRGDSVGNWAIEDYFLGRYHPFPVGIEELDNNSTEILVFPNPANNILSIVSMIRLSDIEVFSINGQLLQKHVCKSNNLSIDISTLPPGNYFIRAIGPDEVFVEKFVVVR